jgi:hypothetical protein
MNEKEIKQLIGDYAESIPPMQRRPISRHSNFKRKLELFTLTVGGLATMGWFTIVFLPARATAGTVRLVSQALLDTRSMEYTSYLKLPGGLHQYLHGYYENGAWRLEAQMHTAMSNLSILKDGQRLMDWERNPFVTIRPITSEEIEEMSHDNLTALDYVKKFVMAGSSTMVRTAHISDHEPINGRPVYALSIRGDQEHYEAIILVDKLTNLPIQSDFGMDDPRPEFKTSRTGVHTEYSFNKPLPASLFALTSKKKIIQAEVGLKHLEGQWKKPIASIGGTDIRNITQTADGMIWIATTPNRIFTPVPLPTHLTDAHGTQFVRLNDIVPSWYGDDQRATTLFDKRFAIMRFAPLYPHAKIAEELILEFESRKIYPDELEHKPKERPATLVIHPAFTTAAIPGYFEPLGIGPAQIFKNQDLWKARGKEFEAKQDWKNAAAAYEQYADVRYHWVKYSAWEPMLKEASCYRKLGQAEKAVELEKKAEALKVSLER